MAAVSKILGLVVLLAALSSCGTQGTGSGERTGPTSRATPNEGTDSPTAAPTATCQPTQGTTEIAAKNLLFDKSCLAAPAGQAFSIKLDNQDAGVLHNLSIYRTSAATESLFVGETFPGVASRTYNVKALDRGMYYFRCDVHPNMSGSFQAA